MIKSLRSSADIPAGRGPVVVIVSSPIAGASRKSGAPSVGLLRRPHAFPTVSAHPGLAQPGALGSVGSSAYRAATAVIPVAVVACEPVRAGPARPSHDDTGDIAAGTSRPLRPTRPMPWTSTSQQRSASSRDRCDRTPGLRRLRNGCTCRPASRRALPVVAACLPCCRCQGMSS